MVKNSILILKNIEEALEISQNALNEKIDRVDAVRSLLNYMNIICAEEKEEYNFLIYFDSETEEFPSVESRKYFAKKYLEELDDRKQSFLQELKLDLDNVFSNLVEYFQAMQKNLKDEFL